MPLGTIVNTISVMVGSLIGLTLKNRFSQNIKSIVFQAIGLCTLVIGVQMALEVKNILILIFSILIGGIIGELIKLEDRFNNAAKRLESKQKVSDGRFSEGLITAFLIFCMGSMTIVGALDEGLRGNHSILLTKSVLDGFTSLALASTYGIGVFFSAIPLFIFQGGITLLAVLSKEFFTGLLISQLTSVGGTMVIGLGINLLDIKRIKVLNLLPALVIVVILTLVFLK